MFYHNTIRRYTLALLDFFNNMEIQYLGDGDEVITKSVPIRYKTREKLLSIDKSTEQILSGNTNVLPRAELEFTGLSADTERQASKYLKINRLRKGSEADYQMNCLSYEFSFTVKVLCRGFNEVSQLIEQVAPKFNPIVNIDVRDAEDEQEPTRIPVQLDGVEFDVPEYEAASNNICTVSFNLKLFGYLFQPIKTYSLVKELHVNLNTPYLNSVKMSFDVKDSIQSSKYTRTEFVRDDYFVIEDLKLEFDGISKVSVSYKSNSREPPKISFVSETCRISNVSGNSCTVDALNFVLTDTNEVSFDICAILEQNGQYYKVFKEFSCTP